MKKYTEWKCNELEKVVKNILMTLSYLDKHKARDGDNAYTSSQLDDINHCIDILHKVHKDYIPMQDTHTHTTHSNV